MRTPTYAIPLKRIAIDKALQPRCDGISEFHVAALMESPENWPPIAVVQEADSLVLIDGFHRYEAATRLGFESIPAIIVERPTHGDCFRLAFDLNATHGRHLTVRDRKAYAKVLLEQHPDLSDRDIGRRTSLNHETVRSLRDEKTLPSSRIAARKPGELEADIALFDPIRFAKATREQKAVAGYIKRLARAITEPYIDDGSALVLGWAGDPNHVASACFAAMGAQRAFDLLDTLEFGAKFIVAVAKARKATQVTS